MGATPVGRKVTRGEKKGCTQNSVGAGRDWEAYQNRQMLRKNSICWETVWFYILGAITGRRGQKRD